GACYAGGAQGNGGPIVHRRGWVESFRKESGYPVKFRKCLGRAQLRFELFKIHPFIDRALKQILSIEEHLHAGGGRQSVDVPVNDRVILRRALQKVREASADVCVNL